MTVTDIKITGDVKKLAVSAIKLTDTVKKLAVRAIKLTAIVIKLAFRAIKLDGPSIKPVDKTEKITCIGAKLDVESEIFGGAGAFFALDAAGFAGLDFPPPRRAGR